MLLELYSETYIKNVVFENGKKVIYVAVLRAIYGMVVSDILLYKEFCGYLENIGFEFNTYDPFATNRIKYGKKNTVILYVDNIMYIHVNPKVNYKFKEWMKHNYGRNGEVKFNRGKSHKYLRMTFDFT